MASSALLFFLPAIFIYLPLTAAKYYDHHCINTSNYTALSAFELNLKFTLENLNDTLSYYAYDRLFSSTVGDGADMVQLILHCRMDISRELCKTCLKKSSEDIIRLCPTQREAIIYDDECMLRYANRPIHKRMEETPASFGCNPANVSDSESVQFHKTLTSLMNSMVPSAHRYSSMNVIGEENVTSSRRIYGLVECTGDIASSDCNICLSRAIWDIQSSQLCGRSLGGRIMKPSCNVRFELDPFYQKYSYPAFRAAGYWSQTGHLFMMG